VEIRDLPLAQLTPAPWNPNEADPATLERLGRSLGRFGTVLPLVVRPLADGFEVLGGNQRLQLYRAQELAAVPCVVVDVGDVEARLLAQALNTIHGADDLGRKAALVRDLLAAMPAEEVATLLPESVDALRGLARLGQEPGSLADDVRAWAATQEIRLERVSFPFTSEQREIVEAAITRALLGLPPGDAPNRRAMALVTICEGWMAQPPPRRARRGRGRRRVVSAGATPQADGVAPA